MRKKRDLRHLCGGLRPAKYRASRATARQLWSKTGGLVSAFRAMRCGGVGIDGEWRRVPGNLGSIPILKTPAERNKQPQQGTIS